MVKIGLLGFDDPLIAQLSRRLHRATLERFVASRADSLDGIVVRNNFESFENDLSTTGKLPTVLLADPESFGSPSTGSPSTNAMWGLDAWHRWLPMRENVAFVNRRRWRPSLRTIRTQLQLGKLGAPGLLRMHRWEDATPNVSTDVSGKWSLSRLLDVDLHIWLMAGTPKRVYATQAPTGTGKTSIRQVHCGWAEGGMSLFDAVTGLAGRDPYFSLSIIGAAGAAYDDDHTNRQLVFQESGPMSTLDTDSIVDIAGVLQAFVDCIATRPSLMELRTRLDATDVDSMLQLAASVDRSIQAGEAIEL